MPYRIELRSEWKRKHVTVDESWTVSALKQTAKRMGIKIKRQELFFHGIRLDPPDQPLIGFGICENSLILVFDRSPFDVDEDEPRVTHNQIDEWAYAEATEITRLIQTQTITEETRDEYGRSFWHQAIDHPPNYDIIWALNIRNINDQDESGNTPLHKAAEWGMRSGCRWLLEHGASADLTNESGKTAWDVGRAAGWIGRDDVTGVITATHHRMQTWMARRWFIFARNEGHILLNSIPFDIFKTIVSFVKI
eukprot:TRINITY_DN6395_c0_g1_i1.p1 TRINITY_DN6395_c0_g1~~TRINITY_DN6395_c0_g1_i1.p1  ORF type:complete len:251 (+),score=23.09 TRINITY_DN6395_c0_g1_i1:71-823(+)